MWPKEKRKAGTILLWPGRTRTTLPVLLFFIFILLTQTLLLVPGAESKITINENGGYEDIVVSIEKSVPPISCSQLIHNIQGIFTSASEYLRQATDGRLYFHRIVIVVPETWDQNACGRSLSTGGTSYTARNKVATAAFRIGPEHPIFGHIPWTQQSKGCGQEGDFVSVGYHYILQFNETESMNAININSQPPGRGGQSVRNDYSNGFETTSVPTERAIVKEWAKYRFGVFEERGFLNDPVYPPSYHQDGERKVTSCTNSPVVGNWSLEGCDESSGRSNDDDENATGEKCFFKPSQNSRENDRIISSINAFPELKNVQLFCDSTTHNRRAPTKQNFLCEGKSISDVIYAHRDFKGLAFREPSWTIPQPEFVVKKIISPRFVILIEESGNMNIRDIWKFLKLAVRKFIKYDLTLGTEIGMISVGSNEVRVLCNITALDSSSIRRALADKLPNYPNVDSGGNISLRRGIFQAVEILKQNQQKAAGSVIILISQGTVSSPDLETSLELLHREEVTLAAIEYPSLGDGKISLLAQGTDGPSFSIRESGVGPNTHIRCYVQLINALLAIQREFTEDIADSWPTMIHQAEYKGDSRSFVEANFSIESTTSQSSTQFFIYTSNPNDPKINSAVLTSPNGIASTIQLSDFHDINVIKIDALINEPGIWKYKIERLADSHQSHFVQVQTKTTQEDLSVRLYSNVDHDKVANLTKTPLILYVEVKRKNSPVIDADVEALIISSNKKWKIRLLDNGNGDPDLTKNDGVYSRYFLPPSGPTTTLEISAKIVVNPYRARFSVPNQEPISQTQRSIKPESPIQPCCGSFLSPADLKQYRTVPFGERTSNSISFRVSDIPPSIGFYPPSRIGDLRVTSMKNMHSLNISLGFIGVGEDLDQQGMVASYQVFYSKGKSNENWALLDKFTGDTEPGIFTQLNLTLPSYGSYMLSVRAIDFNGNTGMMSNIVEANISPEPRRDEIGILNGGNSLGITGSTTPSSSTEELTKFDLMLIIICGISFVLLLAGLIIMLLYCRKISSPNSKGNKNSGENSKQKISSITDPKSPIHWSASELLGEHEKRNSMYGGGSVSPQGSDQNSRQSQQTQQTNAIPFDHQNGHLIHPSQHQNRHGGMSLNNILPQEQYLSSSSRSSRDSYDDPESPTPIPVSVRNRPAGDYSICIGGGDNNTNSYLPSHQAQHPSIVPPPGHHFQQQSMQQQQQHHKQAINYAQQQQAIHNNHGYINALNNSSTSSTIVSQRYPNNNTSPLPPPPHNLMCYEPDIHSSMNSISKKRERNITMV